MKPVDQTKLYAADGTGNGNCFASCLASLLELPLWMVPPFEEMFGRGHGEWRERVEKWLKHCFSLVLVRTEGHEISKLPEFYIANGMSKRGVHHSVIYQNGELAHDPHWMKSGIESVEWTWHLEPLGARTPQA